MALSILDGNQTATTLSTVISSGAHIPAHTVVSLGSQAITDMRSAVSGSVVSISNFPSTQTIAGTVTVAGSNFDGDGNLLVTLQPGQTPYTQPISGTVTAVAQGINVQNGLPTNLPIASAGDGFIEDGARLGVQLLGQDGLQVGQGSSCVLPINGTVTAQLNYVAGSAVGVDGGGNDQAGIRLGFNTDTEFSIVANNNGLPIQGTVTIGSLPAISGTVTANLSSVPTHGVTIANSSVTVNGTFYQATQPVSLASLPSLAAGTAQIGSVTANISGTPTVTMGSISGTVTANVASTTVTVSALPSGALTTRFGSVTTANTAQLTTAVTNSTRKYLFAQNLDLSTTVTIGIGFTPTTTQGIQLAAGGGIIMDSFISTGAVWWLSSTTGSNFTILEG